MDKLIAKILYLLGFRYKKSISREGDEVIGYGKLDEYNEFQFPLLKGIYNIKKINHDWCMKYDKIYAEEFEFHKNHLFDLLIVKKIDEERYLNFVNLKGEKE